MAKGQAATARAVALAGPCGSGKTQLMEALLFAAGAIDTIGRFEDGSRVGDRSPQARSRGLSTEINVAGFEYLDDRYWVIDTPGSVEFAADGACALAAADVAVVVAEPDPEKAVALQIALKRVQALGVPTMLFVNKIDQARGRVRDLLAALQDVSDTPLVMRQIPIWEGEDVTGFVDLALERAYVYRAGEASKQVDIPSALADREADARFQMLERLADFDDTLMEALIEDQEPDRERVFTDLASEMAGGHITPVFLGSAIGGGGVRRLLKALRHETPTLEETAARVFGSAPPEPTGLVLKSRHAGQSGKQSVVRVLSGSIADGATLRSSTGATSRIGGMMAPVGKSPVKQSAAGAGDVAIFSRLNDIGTGDAISAGSSTPQRIVDISPPEPVCARAIAASARSDEVKMAAAIAKLLDEDQGLVYGPDPDTGQLMLRGQGEVHLNTAIERMKSEFGVELDARPPATPYRETVRKSVSCRGRHKKQSGGHGQFGDAVLEVRPLDRGNGFDFDTRIAGGVVPRQYFSAVEDGARDAMEKGPLGFPVIDVGAVLVDGSHHSVDSSEIAFRTAGRIAMSNALAEAGTALLEPIWRVVIHAPSDLIAPVTRVVTEREGRVLGIDARAGWSAWDDLAAHIPYAGMDGLIIELRSATQGAASYEAVFEHYAEVTGRRAQQVRDQA